MWVTVGLLAALVVGGAVLWRWSWERWRRALVAEQAGRARDRFAAETELGRWRAWGVRLQGLSEEQRAELLLDQVWVDLAMWESEFGEEP